jgi:amidase
MDIEASIDYIGPMTNSVSENALLLEVLAGYGDSTEQNPLAAQYTSALGKDIDSIRIGIVREGFGHEAGYSEVDECVRKAADKLSTLGANVEEVSVPLHNAGMGIWGAVVTEGLWQSMQFNGLGYNSEGYYSPALQKAAQDIPQRVSEMPFNVQLLILMGEYVSRYKGKYYAKAKNQVHALRAAYDRALEKYDVLLMPTTVRTAVKNPPSLEEASKEVLIDCAFGNTFNTCQFNASGHPAMSLPCGLREELPAGMMLVGRHFQESLIYQVAHAYEQSVDWQSE